MNILANKRTIAGLAVGAALAFPHAASALIVDFEHLPALATGPSLFANAGNPKAVNVQGLSFNGGVVLGFPTFFPASPFSTKPNVYGTAYAPAQGITNKSFTPELRIEIDSDRGAKRVEGLLFNGLTTEDNFVVKAFSGGKEVDKQNFDMLPSNISEGFAEFRLKSGGPSIDLVTIMADTTSGAFKGQWDFLIDTIAVGEPIENILNGNGGGGNGGVQPIPVPAALPLFASALAGMGVFGWRRRKAA